MKGQKTKLLPIQFCDLCYRFRRTGDLNICELSKELIGQSGRLVLIPDWCKLQEVKNEYQRI